MEKPLVSVIIPAYNHEKYVQETIKSIINQTYKNIELIVIDDGSKDLTWAKIQELKGECEKRFKRTVFETRKNQGVVASMNYALSLTKGEYIFSIASDDMAKPELIETETDFLINNPKYSLCACDSEFIDSENKICYWDKKRNIVYNKQDAKYKTFVEFLKKHNPYFNNEKFGSYSTLYAKNYIPNGFTVRKVVYSKIGSYPDGVLEDWWFMLQFSKYFKMKYIDKPMYLYRWHNSNTIKNLEKMKNITKKTLQWEENFLNESDISQFMPEVKETKENGAVLKTQGLPFVFEVVKIAKFPNIIKTIKLFNIKIYETVKSM